MKWLGFLMFASHLAWASPLQVVKSTGEVTYDKKPVKVGDKLTAGGFLEVGADGSVDIAYPEGHHFRLKQKGKLRLEVNPISKDVTTFDLLYGKLYARFAKDKGADKFQIKTPTMVAGVRGTKFMTEYDDKNQSYVC